MISHLRRTKVIATFGPSITQKLWTWEIFNNPKNVDMVKKAYDMTEKILAAGVNTARFNFSHGTYEEQLIRVKIIREVTEKLKRPVSLMLDTKGPEIRVFDIGSEDGRMYNLGDKIEINCLERIIGGPNNFSILDSTGTYNMAKDVHPGNQILVDDGKLSLTVDAVDVDKGIIQTTANNPHLLKTNKRINLPNSEYTIPFLSEKDRADIAFAVENKFSYIAASFTNSKQNILDIKAILKEKGGENIKVIAKIETKQGIDQLDEIISVSDGIMIARGDLGLEVPYYEVPYWGKFIIKKCRFANCPVIMATQMLDSLEENIIPTRAESSDVFWAVELGVDATMLSGESAQGKFPVNAVDVMTKINKQSEIFFDYKRSLETYFPRIQNFKSPKGQFAKKIAEIISPHRNIFNEGFEYQGIATFTNDYEFLKLLSATRPAARILAFTNDVKLYNTCGILYGVRPILVEDLENAKKCYCDYVGTYYNNQYQTKHNVELTRKTLVVLDDEKLTVMDANTKCLDITPKIIHKNF